jgi:hypothetical protein
MLSVLVTHRARDPPFWTLLVHGRWVGDGAHMRLFCAPLTLF